MQALIPRKAVVTLCPGGVQAMQVLIPRQVALVPPTKKDCRHSQAGSATPSWEEQAMQVLIPRRQHYAPTRKECRHSFPGSVSPLGKEHRQ